MNENNDDPQADTGPPSEDPAPPSEDLTREHGSSRSPRRAVRLIVLLIFLAVLAVAAWFGWQWWQQQQMRVAAASQASHNQIEAVTELRQHNAKLQSQLDAGLQQTSELQSKLESTTRTSEALQGKLDGLSRRVSQLESAVSSLSQKQISGAERMRLEDVAMLLTQAGQRYTLLHDGVSALAALRMARKQLADVDDPAFSGIARTLDDEIRALAATRPALRQGQLDRLEQLRRQWPSLPLKPLDNAEQQQAATGTWSRIWGALSTLVIVRREGDADEVETADTRLARQVSMIDLARAEAALLSNNPSSALDAVKRASTALKRDYDPASPLVAKSQETLSQLGAELDEAGRADVQLGAALTALRNQLQVREMNALPLTAPDTRPAHTGTAGGT